MALLDVEYFHSLHSLVQGIESVSEERRGTVLRRDRIMPRDAKSSFDHSSKLARIGASCDTVTRPIEHWPLYFETVWLLVECTSCLDGTRGYARGK
jgi:hypothetical protein